MTKFQLMSALFANNVKSDNALHFKIPGIIEGIFQGIKREDGSGNCFIVSVLVKGEVQKVFVRTVD